MPKNTLTGRSIRIRVNKPPHLGVIIAAVEVVESRLVVVVIATITNGVDDSDLGAVKDLLTVGIRHRQQLAPRVVFVVGDHRAGGVDQADDVPLPVVQVIIPHTVELEAVHGAVLVVQIGQGVAICPHLAQQQTVGPVIGGGGIVRVTVEGRLSLQLFPH